MADLRSPSALSAMKSIASSSHFIPSLAHIRLSTLFTMVFVSLLNSTMRAASLKGLRLGDQGSLAVMIMGFFVMFMSDKIASIAPLSARPESPSTSSRSMSFPLPKRPL